MKKLTVDEFRQEYPELWDYTDETKTAVFIYISDFDECLYIGVEYSDGSVWVYGARADREVTCEELAWYLEQEG